MSDKQKPSMPVQAAKLVLNIANGRHKLSKAIPMALFVIDALLCAAIILKVPCEQQFPVFPALAKLIVLPRH